MRLDDVRAVQILRLCAGLGLAGAAGASASSLLAVPGFVWDQDVLSSPGYGSVRNCWGGPDWFT
jgi:hypothetical protein